MADRKATARRVAAGLLVLLVCGVSIHVLGWQALMSFPGRYRDSNMYAYVDQGERLIHGVRGDVVLERLPASAVAGALLYSSPASSGVLKLVSIALMGLLLTAIDGLSDVPAVFGLAPLLAGLFVRWEYPQELMIFEVLIVAGFLIRYASKPDLRGAAWLAAAVGGTFLFRSDLALLPPVVAVVSSRYWRRDGLKRRVKELAVVLCGPYLFTLPTVWSNLRTGRVFLPFEQAGLFKILAEGLAGVVETRGDMHLAPTRTIPAGHVVAAVSAIAHEVAARPRSFVFSYLGRILLAAEWCSPFIVFAVVAAWARRKQRAPQALSLFGAYWFGTYCVMAITQRYFEPLVPVLILLASWVAADAIGMHAVVPRRLASGVLFAALTGLLALDAYAAFCVLRPSGASPEDAVPVGRSDWWFLKERGESRLRRRAFDEAEHDFRAAAGMVTTEVAEGLTGDELRLEAAAARLFARRPDSAWSIPFDDADEAVVLQPETHLLRALAFSREGLRDAPPRELDGAYQSWQSYIGGESFWFWIRSQGLRWWPFAEKLELERMLALRFAGDAQAWDVYAGSLARAEGPSRARAELGRLAVRVADLSARRRIASILSSLENAERDELIERASVSAGRGRGEAAASELKQAVELKPSPEQRRRIEVLRSVLRNRNRARKAAPAR